jgi:hypothetical protein
MGGLLPDTRQPLTNHRVWFAGWRKNPQLSLRSLTTGTVGLEAYSPERKGIGGQLHLSDERMDYRRVYATG